MAGDGRPVPNPHYAVKLAKVGAQIERSDYGVVRVKTEYIVRCGLYRLLANLNEIFTSCIDLLDL